jgi:hypothetical protein
LLLLPPLLMYCYKPKAWIHLLLLLLLLLLPLTPLPSRLLLLLQPLSTAAAACSPPNQTPNSHGEILQWLQARASKLLPVRPAPPATSRCCCYMKHDAMTRRRRRQIRPWRGRA